MALRRKFQQTKLFRALIVFALLVVLALAAPRFITDPVRIFFVTAGLPFERFFSASAYGIRDFFGFVGSIGELKQENERLARERIELEGENATLKTLARENEVLRREIGLIPREQHDLAAVEVIGRGGTTGDGTILVSRGSRHGITEGMPVIVGKGVLIGRVAEVLPYNSTVVLLAHPESFINAMTANSGALGIAKGEHGLGLLLDMVLQSGTLSSGDSVVTSGLDPGVPQGLLIGTLQEPRFTQDRLYQQASIVSPVKFESVRYVFIITNTK